jgi:hypothetical protein
MTLPASHDTTGAYPALLWDRVGVVNVSARTTHAATTPAWWTRTAATPADTVVGDLPAGVVSGGDGTAVTLDTLVGELSGVDTGHETAVTVDARDIWGYPVAATVDREVVRRGELSLVVDERTVTATLTGADGRPLTGRLLAVDGATVDTVRTNATGEAVLRAAAGVVHVRFAGDSWRDPRPQYYDSVGSSVVVPSGFLLPITGVVGLIDSSVSWGLVIVEWVALLAVVGAWRWGRR